MRGYSMQTYKQMWPSLVPSRARVPAFLSLALAYTLQAIAARPAAKSQYILKLRKKQELN